MSETDPPAQQHVEGKQFDEPLIIAGSIDREPERYVAEKPYDLTRYEYSVLKRPATAELWFSLVSGATGGVVISVIAKAVSALLDKQHPQLETWEIVAVVMGVCASLLLKFCVRAEDDVEKERLFGVVNRHFSENRPRRLHLTGGSDKQ